MNWTRDMAAERVLSPDDHLTLYGPGWTVVQLLVDHPPRPNDDGTIGHEFALEREIKAKGFLPYAPRWRIHRRRRGWRNHTIETAVRALFPDYLFVLLDTRFVAADFSTNSRSVKRLPGFATAAQVEVVREIELEANKLPIERVVRQVRPGEMALIIRGVLKGDTAEVLRVKGRSAIVNLARQGRRSVVTMNACDLEPALAT